jgi:hypothetical protein
MFSARGVALNVTTASVQLRVLHNSVYLSARLKLRGTNTKYMLLSRHQNAGQNRDINIGNRCFDNVEQFRYLGLTVANENLIQEEIKRRMNSGNAFYHSVRKFLSSRLLSNSVKIRIYKTMILPVVLYGCETWYMTLKE